MEHPINAIQELSGEDQIEISAGDYIDAGTSGSLAFGSSVGSLMMSAAFATSYSLLLFSPLE